MEKKISLAGEWAVELADGTQAVMTLPGTLDENQIGHKDMGANQWHPEANIGNAGEDFDGEAPIATRFTRKYTYEGAAYLTKEVTFPEVEGKRIFFDAERARCLRLQIDGKEIEAYEQGTISTPYCYEVTGTEGTHTVTLISDNSYPGLPHDAIVYSSAATDETQTNWNGILGTLQLRIEEPVFINKLEIYPQGRDGKPESLKIRVGMDAAADGTGILVLQSEAMQEVIEVPVTFCQGQQELCAEAKFAETIKLWDEDEGNLYEMKASFHGKIMFWNGTEQVESTVEDRKQAVYGIRIFGDNGKGRLALNGRTIFIRSEANCAEFPEAGHPPVTVTEWLDVLARYRAYGINLMRFHSHCPPEAAFIAADQMGMLMQPELSCWNPVDAFEQEESYTYYKKELRQVLKMLANHPSFVMLTFGNELQAHALGHERMHTMIAMAKAYDETRLYADSSNAHYGAVGVDAESDFYASQSFYEERIRGTFAGMDGYINKQYPNACTNYDKTLESIRKVYKKPVFSFEVGQFEVLPDFDELKLFHGVSDPANYRLIQKKMEKLGLQKVWKRYVEATGELSRIGYREEIEAAMRTKELSGISLLGLQDFPGQGTALVGMMNSHLEQKPFDFAKPEAFEAFFCAELPLVYLQKYTYEWGETLQADVIAANFGKMDIEGDVTYQICDKNKKVYKEGVIGACVCPNGELTKAGTLTISLDFEVKPMRFDLIVQVADMKNTYPIWIYPNEKVICPETVYETTWMDEKAKKVLEEGGIVYLTPESTKEALPSSIQAQFTTDFWSVGTFCTQEGGMGQLIDETHPIFEQFPTEFHTNWQWWPMAKQRAFLLPKSTEAIITEMDSYAYMRPMAQLFEVNCGTGKVMLSSMGLQNLQQYPEARALQRAIYAYMASEAFAPKETWELAAVEALVCRAEEMTKE